MKLFKYWLVRCWTFRPRIQRTARVRRMTIRRDPERTLLRDVYQAAEEAPSRMLVALLAQHRVDQLPVAVDRPVEVAPAAGDFHVGLVDVPGPARLASSFGAQPFPEQRREAKLPATNCFVRDLVAALQQQLRDFAKAELVAQPPQHGEQHDVGRVLELVEAGAGPLVESAPTRAAVESPVAQCRAAGPSRRCGRLAVRTRHRDPLVISEDEATRCRRALNLDETPRGNLG